MENKLNISFYELTLSTHTVSSRLRVAKLSADWKGVEE